MTDTKPDTNRQTLLDAIIERELDMFLAVANRGGVSACQERPETFRIMRWTSHSVLSDAYLTSYLDDLKQAQLDNRNFMTEKYALMEGQIPPLSTDPRIDEIVHIEGAWRDELAIRYPHVLQPLGGAHFRLYLGSELQTLSELSLSLYAKEIIKADSQNENLLEKRYQNLFHKMGYPSLEAGEEAMHTRSQTHS